MFICLCKGVTDTQIRQCVERGAGSLQAVRDETGAATQCCKCLPDTRRIVHKALEAKENRRPLLSPAMFFPSSEPQG